MSTGIAAAMGSLKPLRVTKPSGSQAPEHPGTHAPEVVSSRAPESLSTRAPGLSDDGAKRSHPDYFGMKAYVRKDTHKAAKRRAEDEGFHDLSEVVQMLLERFVKGGLRG